MSTRKARAGPKSSGVGAGAARGRGRRLLPVVGIVLLASALIAFVVSFLTGLGDGSGSERVIGDAERGGAQLDRIGPRVRVEVLNAAGVAGLARRATEQLRDRGFDVVYIGNAGSFEQDSSVVVARTADVDAAHQVARALGIDSVVVEPDAQLYVEATVRLGTNWPRAPDAGPRAPAVGDRVRRMLDRDSARP